MSSAKTPIYFVCKVHRNMDTLSSMDASFAAPEPSTFDIPAATSSFDISTTGAPAEESFLRSPIFIGVVVVIALAIVGFNVFAYLGEGTDMLAGGVMPVIERVTGDLSWFVNKFTDNTTTGTKGAVDVAGDTVKAGAAVPHEIAAGNKGAVVSQQNKKKIDATSAASAGSTTPEQADPDNSMQKALDHAPAQTQQASQNPEPADTKSSGPGYCYIGEDQGYRSCISVSDSTKCMSGDVYTNLDACQRSP
jgi:hypothetical protein